MDKKSFTLIELIVVIAIIAVLAAIVAPNAFRAIEKAKVSEIIGDFKTYKTGIYALYADTGQWVIPEGVWDPANFETRICPLVEDCHNWSGWDGPYVEKIKPKTPWEGSYSVESWGDFDNDGHNELWLDFEDYCYPDGPHGPCKMPWNSFQQLDQKVDDGQCGDGNVRHGKCGLQTDQDVAWIIVWDAF